MNIKTTAIFAGFFFATLATFTQGLLPMLEPQSTTDRVTRVVRTDSGDLKWMHSTATDYSELETEGRQTYIAEGCMYCHSQYIRPVAGESRRWGPVAQAGEYAFDQPHLFSTRRIGPDLSRVGLKYSDEWHLAHFWDPRTLVPGSIMPRFSKFFDVPDAPVQIVTDELGQTTLEQTEVTKAIFDFSKADDSNAQIYLTPNAEGLLFVRHRGKYPIVRIGDEFSGDQVTLTVMTDKLEGLIAYLQKLGTNRGKWRDKFEPQNSAFAQVSLEKSSQWLDFGKKVYQQRCAACHGVDGDGNGPAATFMYNNRPRDFTKGVYKFRTTSSDSLPTDADLMRTLTQGVRGTAMPSWHMLSEKERMAVVQYVKYELSVDRSDPEEPYVIFVEEEPEAPLHIGRTPAFSDDMLADGKEIWQSAKCWECHGNSGAGDGEKAAGLEDDNRFPIFPADLTSGQFKSGSSIADIYRTISMGLSGTPMPSYIDSFNNEERWALSYYVVSLSAYTDPLTKQKLAIPESVRQALNSADVIADSSNNAYSAAAGSAQNQQIFGGNAWASRRGMEVVEDEQAPSIESTPTATN